MIIKKIIKVNGTSRLLFSKVDEEIKETELKKYKKQKEAELNHKIHFEYEEKADGLLKH